MKLLSPQFTPMVQVGKYGNVDALFRMAISASFHARTMAAELESGASMVQFAVKPSQFGPTLKLKDIGVDMSAADPDADALRVMVVIKREPAGWLTAMAGLTSTATPRLSKALMDADMLQQRTGRTCHVVSWDGVRLGLVTE